MNRSNGASGVLAGRRVPFASVLPSPRYVQSGCVGSTGRCNTGVKSLRWGFECQSLTRPFVELTSHFVQMSLRMHRQVGPLREVLPEQTIGVFIGTALPRTLRIAEVNGDVGR